MQKHAYFIIAHNEFDLLETLVRLLDDPPQRFDYPSRRQSAGF
jgi:hypothetical protein